LQIKRLKPAHIFTVLYQIALIFMPLDRWWYNFLRCNGQNYGAQTSVGRCWVLEMLELVFENFAGIPIKESTIFNFVVTCSKTARGMLHILIQV
jgi:hypothetical protein